MLLTAQDITKIISDFKSGKKESLVRFDFGERVLKVKLWEKGIILPDERKVKFPARVKENFLYYVCQNEIVPVAWFSEDTGLYYKLIPTADWPTISLSSVPMHRKTLCSPRQDAEIKVEILSPYGIHLETCGGLGYTAILSAKYADKIYCFEKDENVLEMAKLNPFSKDLFENPKIIVENKDISIEIKEFEDNFFNTIMHDPPTFRFAPELYNIEFYRQIYRILKPGGRLFHYTPQPGIKRGRNFPREVKGRLKSVGFINIKYFPSAQGFLCFKR